VLSSVVDSHDARGPRHTALATRLKQKFDFPNLFTYKTRKTVTGDRLVS